MLSLTALALLAAACTTSPGPDGPTTTTITLPGQPVIAVFSVIPGSSPAPALVTFRWTASDPVGDPLTCRLDPDGDGDFDHVLTDCAGTSSRTHYFETGGTFTAKVQVEDGITPPAILTKTVNIGAGVAETYDIQLRPIGTIGPAEQAAFDAAEALWESVIARGVADVNVNLAADACLAGSAPLSGVVDDLIIDFAIRPIDGVGQILGQAGPCTMATGDRLTRVGGMEFDSDDVATMLAAGTFDEIVVHEMGHVLGIGTLWSYYRSLLTGAGGPDPRYVGAAAVAEYQTLGGAEADIPIEASGGPGTNDSHWRESVFDDELMTGYIDAGSNPLSMISIASMADLGYRIDPAAAQAYSLPMGAVMAAVVAANSVAHSEQGTMLRPARSSVVG